MQLFKPKYPKRAVAYYRHSRDKAQENSVAIQKREVEKFANHHGIEILKVFIDWGITGLKWKNRPAFIELIEWVANPDSPPCDYVLVYDASRWGRLKDQDEAASLAFSLKQNGKRLVDITRGLPKDDNDDGGFMEQIQTVFDRHRAHQFSRDLSIKVTNGCKEVVRQGYSAGGTPPYGMRRVLLDESKHRVRPLKKGEQKQVSNERVIFEPAGDEATQTVKDIFELFANRWEAPSEIASALNNKDIPAPKGGLWNHQKIVKIIGNPAYVGTKIYNRKSKPSLDADQAVMNPRSEWIIRPKTYDPIVDEDTFQRAQNRVYWNLSSQSRKGRNIIAREVYDLKEQFRAMLLEQGKYSDYEIDEVLRKLPLALSLKVPYKAGFGWWFVIDGDMKQFDYVLCGSVISEGKDHRDKFFIIPTKDFGSHYFMLLLENSIQYQSYYVPETKLQESIDTFLKQFEQTDFRILAEGLV